MYDALVKIEVEIRLHVMRSKDLMRREVAKKVLRRTSLVNESLANSYQCV